MTTHRFRRYNYDSYVYFRKKGDGSFIYLLLYVDDMLIAARDKKRNWKGQISIKCLI